MGFLRRFLALDFMHIITQSRARWETLAKNNMTTCFAERNFRLINLHENEARMQYVTCIHEIISFK